MRTIPVRTPVYLVFAAGLVLAGCGQPVAVSAQQSTDSSLESRLINASPYSVQVDEELNAFVQARGRSAYDEHCAGCHGVSMEGRPGVPGLVDYDWLWGITFEETSDVGPVMELQQTILYGVRNTDCPDIESVSYYGACADTRFSQMPGYGELDVFNDQELDDMTAYVQSLSGTAVDSAAAARGEALFPICTECHGPEGAGYKPYGGPDLTDDVWLFGGDRATIREVIDEGRTEVCPAWANTLDAATIKALAVYIWFRANGVYGDVPADDQDDVFDFSQ